MADKKYYWLKLQKNFFKRHDVKIIKAMDNGLQHVHNYLQLMLESIDHEGTLRFSDEIPYTVSMLAAVIDEDKDTLEKTFEILKSFRLLEIWDDGTIFLTKIPEMLGCESEAAERVRKYREKKQSESDDSSEDDQGESSMDEPDNYPENPCNEDVTDPALHCNNAVTSCNAHETPCNGGETSCNADVTQSKSKSKREIKSKSINMAPEAEPPALFGPDEIESQEEAPPSGEEPLGNMLSFPDPDTLLYNRVKDLFEQKQPQGKFTNYGKEGAAIKQLIAKSRARSPDDDFLIGMIQMFDRLREQEGFYRKQPFLPSALNSSGIWDRVLNAAQLIWVEGQTLKDMEEEEILF